MPQSAVSPLRPRGVRRAVHLSYAQAMIGAVYSASTGGMFLIGYALKLGADNVQIGLMSTIPMLCVVVQLAASAIVERGVSRRGMTILASLLNVSGWALIILIPYVAGRFSSGVRVGALIAIITFVTLFGNVAGNARGSWIGDLIPPRIRGTFFGRLNMYGSIVGVVFAVLEGAFLDVVRNTGVGAFSILFGFGMAFGLANAGLFAPQADVPLAPHESPAGFGGLIRQTFTNRPLMLVMGYVMLWAMQSIAGPFFVTYMLRDLKMPFLGVGIINGVATLTILVFSPFWGRVVGRYGCRPVLVLCTFVLAPVPLIWFALSTPLLVYAVVIPVNLLVGFLIAGISVGITTLLYKVTPAAGRSVQFAIHSILVTLVTAPMPTIGGCLPDWFHALGIAADLRVAFYVSAVFIAAAAFAARRIQESGSLPTADLLRNLPSHLCNPGTLRAVQPVNDGRGRDLADSRFKERAGP